MKRLAILLLTIAMLVPAAAAAQETPDLGQVLQDFGRRPSGNGLDLLLVHLNDKSTDVLFEPPSKYSLRAQARQVTMFYVLGTADRSAVVSTDYRVRQTEISVNELRLSPHSISGFEDGARLAAGDTFIGILMLDQVLSLRTPFSVVQEEHTFVFEFTPNVLSQLAP